MCTPEPTPIPCGTTPPRVPIAKNGDYNFPPPWFLAQDHTVYIKPGQVTSHKPPSQQESNIIPDKNHIIPLICSPMFIGQPIQVSVTNR